MKAVFFDFGGTLMDADSDREAHREIVEKVKERYSLSRSTAELSREFERALFAYSPERAKKWIRAEKIITEFFRQLVGEGLNIQWLWDVYFDAHRRHCRLFPDAKPAIDQIRRLQLHIGIISDIDDDYFTFQTKQFSMDGLFDSITTSDSVGVGKPNPRIFEVALAAAGCDAAEAVYIGDSFEKDILGAREAGMSSVWYKGETSEFADWVVQTLSEIPPIITALQRAEGST